MNSRTKPTFNDKPSTRKGSKPQVERKRRARINHSLAELQSLVIDKERFKLGGGRVEKAEILDMTVRHIRAMNGTQPTEKTPAEVQTESSTEDDNNFQSTRHNFNIGYLDCTNRACQYLLEVEKVDPKFHDRLKSHLMETYEIYNVKNGQPATTPVENNLHRIDAKTLSSESDDSDSRTTTSSSSPTPLYVGLSPELDKIVHIIPGRLDNRQVAYVIPQGTYDNFHSLMEQSYYADVRSSTNALPYSSLPFCHSTNSVTDNRRHYGYGNYIASGLYEIRPPAPASLANSVWRPF